MDNPTQRFVTDRRRRAKAVSGQHSTTSASCTFMVRACPRLGMRQGVPAIGDRRDAEAGSMQRPSTGEVLLWGLVTAALWTLAGVATAIVLYENESREPTTSPSPEHYRVLVKILVPWAVTGFVVGVLALFHFPRLFELLGPARSYATHVVHMSVLAVVLGAILALAVYPFVEPPPGAFLLSVMWRIPVCAVAALVGTNLSLSIIPRLVS